MEVVSVGGSLLGRASAGGEACPLNGVVGFLVLRETVVNHVRGELWGRLAPSRKYRFCPDPDCPIAYYENGSRTYVAVWELRGRVFHKERRRDRPVCYCAGVTEEDLLREAARASTLEELMERTGAGLGRWCPITNPSGRCCREYLSQVAKLPSKAMNAAGGAEAGGAKTAAAEEAAGAAEAEGRTAEKAALASGEGEAGRSARVLRIGGMHCEGCAVAVKAALEEAGVKVFRVDFRQGKAWVAPDTDLETARRAIEEVGYRFLGTE